MENKNSKNDIINTLVSEILEKKTVKLKTNLIDWIVYFIFSLIFMAPFFWGQWCKYICISLTIGFFAGLLNRIVRELVFIKEELINKR